MLENRKINEGILSKDIVKVPKSHITHFHIEAFEDMIELIASPRTNKLMHKNSTPQVEFLEDET
jgi:hypothetical protein